MSSWIVLQEHHWLHIYLGECHRWMHNSPTVHTHTRWCSRWWWLLENSIHTSASRRQRDISVWPQEGHFNNGAWGGSPRTFRWKEGVKNRWTAKDDHVNGWEILQPPEQAQSRTHSTAVSSFGATRLVKRRLAAFVTWRSNLKFVELRRRQERVFGSVPSHFAFREKKKKKREKNPRNASLSSHCSRPALPPSHTQPVR